MTARPEDQERIEQVLAELGRYWRSHPELSLGQVISSAAAVLGTEVQQVQDAELMAALELNIIMVPTGLPAGAFRSPTPDTAWSQRPPVLDVIRLHASRTRRHSAPAYA